MRHEKPAFPLRPFRRPGSRRANQRRPRDGDRVVRPRGRRRRGPSRPPGDHAQRCRQPWRRRRHDAQRVQEERQPHPLPPARVGPPRLRELHPLRPPRRRVPRAHRQERREPQVPRVQLPRRGRARQPLPRGPRAVRRLLRLPHRPPGPLRARTLRLRPRPHALRRRAVRRLPLRVRRHAQDDLPHVRHVEARRLRPLRQRPQHVPLRLAPLPRPATTPCSTSASHTSST